MSRADSQLPAPHTFGHKALGYCSPGRFSLLPPSHQHCYYYVNAGEMACSPGDQLPMSLSAWIYVLWEQEKQRGFVVGECPQQMFQPAQGKTEDPLRSGKGTKITGRAEGTRVPRPVLGWLSMFPGCCSCHRDVLPTLA